jgi:hypothetical protein
MVLLLLPLLFARRESGKSFIFRERASVAGEERKGFGSEACEEVIKMELIFLSFSAARSCSFVGYGKGFALSLL